MTQETRPGHRYRCVSTMPRQEAVEEFRVNLVNVILEDPNILTSTIQDILNGWPLTARDPQVRATMRARKGRPPVPLQKT